MPFSTLITATELNELLQASTDVVVFDCRHRLTDTDFGRRAFAESHIPGALFAHLDEDLSGEIVTGVTGRHPLPRVVDFVAFLQRAGVSNQTQVVAYDDLGGAIAARLWWMCRWVGLDSAAVLDGGFAAWVAGGYALESEESLAAKPGSFVPHVRPERVVSASDLGHPGEVVLIDARAADRFAGQNETIDPVAGHIPGAFSIPFAGNLTENGHFAGVPELRSRFAEIADGDRPVACYCGSGVTAAHDILAMVHAGLPEPGLYAGSWSHWITDARRPVATGPA